MVEIFYGWLEEAGLNTPFFYVVIGLVMMIAGIIILGILKIPKPLTMIITFSMILFFIIIEWFPVWLAILIGIILFALIYMMMRGGGVEASD